MAALNLNTYNDLNTAQKVGNYKLFKTVPSNQAISTWKKEIEVEVYKISLTKWAALNLSTYNDLNTAQKVGNYKLFKTVPSNQAISTWKKEIEVEVYEKSLTKWASNSIVWNRVLLVLSLSWLCSKNDWRCF